MSATSPTIPLICLDLGNGYSKITMPSPSGELSQVAIPAYVAPMEFDRLVVNTAQSFTINLDGTSYGVGDRARPLDLREDSKSTHGLWVLEKHLFYRHFLMSLFAGYGDGVDHLTIEKLIVTQQPNGIPCADAVKALASSEIKGLYGKRPVTIRIRNVEGIDETRPTGFLVAREVKPSSRYAVLNVGKGTLHFQVFSPDGSPEQLLTRTGNGDRMEFLRDSIRTELNNFAPSAEALTVAIERGQKSVLFNSRPITLKPHLTKFYKEQAAKLEALENYAISQEVGTVYLVGGGSHCFQKWKPKGFDVIRSLPGVKDPQFTELSGLQLLGSVRYSS